MALPGAGTASCSTPSLAVGSRAVVATVDGAAYDGLAGIGAFTVAQLPAGSAAGGGRVTSGDVTDEFAFQVKPPVRKAPPTGDALHVYRVGSTAVVVRTTSLASMGKTCTSGKSKVCTVTVDGTAGARRVVDLVTGTDVAVGGSPSITLRARDVAEPAGAGADTYTATIGDPDNHAMGTAGSPVPLSSGNVRIA
jgi:hypothetical protein